MSYILGRKSLAELSGVHPDLVRVVKRAIQITTQDFSVHDGIRTKAEQREYVRRRVSRTMNSKHLTQRDGFGHAVDLVPWINGQMRWEWPPIYKIAEAMRQASNELNVPIEWGGIKGFKKLTGTKASPKAMHTGFDGPHYQLAAKYRA